MNTSVKWNGSRWWKVDFHTHTPVSEDYGKGPQQTTLRTRTPKEWLLDYMKVGIDCVVVTDHNSGAWIDELKSALVDLENNPPADYQPIYLFPGVELSVNGGVHLLAIFGHEKKTGDIDSLLGSVGFNGIKGKSGDVTTKSLTEVVVEINNAGGIAIPAHVDDNNGLFKILRGTTLEQALKGGIFAMEIVNPDYINPPIYTSSKLAWAEVLGTDAHHPSGGNRDDKFPGSHFTWVKMGNPSIEGLRLALLDGTLSIMRSDKTTADPNIHAETVIESIEIENSLYMGRSAAFKLDFNPWMNAVIGGRGTGKSTLVEFLRIALRRDDEIPTELEDDFAKYHKVYGDTQELGLLTRDAKIRVLYRKNGALYRVQWDVAGTLDHIEEHVKDDTWQKSDGDIRQRFPVRIFSQKQVFQLAKEPFALMKVVNDAPFVNYMDWKRKIDAEQSQYLTLQANIRESTASLLEESRLKGELEDVKRKLEVFEQGGHADLFKTLQIRRQQNSALDTWESELSNANGKLWEIAGLIQPEAIDHSDFDSLKPEDLFLLDQVKHTTEAIATISEKIEGLAYELSRIIKTWHTTRESSTWKIAFDNAVKAYDELKNRLAGEGVFDTSEYGLLVQRRQHIEKQLKDLATCRAQVADLQKQAKSCFDKVENLRHEITQRRRDFLSTVLKDNPYVRIEVVPYGAKERVETEFRRLIHRDTDGFEKDIGQPDGQGWLGSLYDGNPDTATVEMRIKDLKRKVREIAEKQQQPDVKVDYRFASHLSKLPPEALDRLDLWFPEDSFAVEYSTSMDQHKFRPIIEGSPGQQTAALLAFLLTYGDEPLILDQPEDDLDNHLIYDLIVTQLHKIKRRRQVILVTHNANIVVNGDAELVVALVAHKGQTQQEVAGCLQEKDVRKVICAVMEGGEKAFEQRYRRIALDGRQT